MLSFIARGASMSQPTVILYNVLYVYMLSFIARGSYVTKLLYYIMYYMSVC